MLETTYVIHPLVGLHGGWGSLVMNHTKTSMKTSNQKPTIVSNTSVTLTKSQQRNLQGSKRPYREVESSSDGEDNIPDMWPRFLVIQGTSAEFPLAKLNPFAIEKGIQGLAGTPVSVRRLRSGDLILEVAKKSHSDNLLRSGMLANCPIRVTAHRSMNSRKGVIRCRDLKDTSEKEILDGLSAQGVTEVKKITVQRDGNRFNTGTIILTFGLPALPPTVKCGFLQVRVDTYIPNPLRCFKCQRFGHHKTNCKRDLACARCGTAGHEDKECKLPPHCVNCDGEHGSFSRDCPVWKQEKDIQTVRVTRGITFPEAKKIVQATGNTPTTATTYSAVVGAGKALPSASVACQTELTWPIGAPKPSLIPKKNVQKKTVVSVDTSTSTSALVTNAQKSGPVSNKGGVSSEKPSTNTQNNNRKGAVVAAKPTTPPKPPKKTLPDRTKKGEKNPLMIQNQYSVLDDILDGSSMDYDDLDNLGSSPSGTRPK